jgi:hypothetical protein
MLSVSLNVEQVIPKVGGCRGEAEGDEHHAGEQ